jgi:hypothetical protein
VSGWLKDDNVQFSISSPHLFDILAEARERKQKQGRYHHFETHLARKLQQDIDYKKGYTIKQIQCVGACMADLIYGYKIVQETKLSFGRTWARWFIRRFAVPSQTCKEVTINK